jgi:predicted RNA-binding protein with PIN domain
MLDPGQQPMSQRTRYLIVDGHSIIFAWPELRKLHEQRASLGREALIKQLRDYQDWTGVRVVIVFDGKTQKSQRPRIQVTCRSFIHAADKQLMRLSSDSQANTQIDFN